MTKLFDTKRIRDEQEYWDSLAQRVTRAAVSRGRKEGGVMAFAGSWGAWVTATALAAAAALLLMLSRAESVSASPKDLQAALQPSDAIGRTMMAASNPPSVGELLITADAGRAGTGRQQ